MPVTVPVPALTADGGTTLDDDAMELLWNLLLSHSSYIMKAELLCKSWRDHARKSWKGVLNFDCVSNEVLNTSFENRLARFTNVTALNAIDTTITNADLEIIGRSALPNLHSIDVSGCQMMSSNGVKALIKNLGVRLRCFKQDRTNKHSLCKNLRVTEATMKVLATAPAIEEISLTLGSGVKGGLEILSVPDVPSKKMQAGRTLRKLSILHEGFTHTDLPQYLPELRELSITSWHFSSFRWCPQHDFPGLAFENFPPQLSITNPVMNHFAAYKYPKLELMKIDHRTSHGRSYLYVSLLEFLANKFPTAIIKVVGLGSNCGDTLKDAWKDVVANGGEPIEQTWGVLGGS